jgi:serine/threonine protein kinase
MVTHSHHGSHGSSKDGPAPASSAAGKSSNPPPRAAAPAKENWKIERVAGKDGAAQRAAADVEGLKGYQLGDCLGKGAFGSVYKALNWGTGGTVAIKQVGLSHLPKTELKNMMQEIDLLKNLHHPNIVKYHGFVTSTENLYIILEYCEGGSLNSMIKNFGKFPETLVALYLSQVLQGLLYLHEQGVIHRDIKGANILVMRDGLVKLADFGVATKGNVGESSVVGTPYWMAPEVIQLSGATTASDIWSLGCTAIELLDGTPPYSNFQPMPALFRIVNDDHPPLPEGASPVVRDFLIQCFQKDPNLRVSAKKLLKHPWIVNAKRADVAPTMKGVEKPTQQAAAQRTIEEWNAALQSPEGESARRGHRQASLSPAPMQREPKPLQLTTPGFAKAPVAATKSKPSLDALASPELDTDDNWDLDFDPPSSPRGLQLQRLKPQDHFAGMFSHERLKSLAQFGSMTEEIIEEEPDQTARHPIVLSQFDPLETVRPFTPQKTKKKAEVKPVPSNTSSQRIPSQPKAQPLREPARKVNLPAGKLRLTAPQQPLPTSIYQEESDEDFSDMLDDDEDDAAFQRKLQELRLKEESSFSPKLFQPSDLKNPPKAVSNGRKSGSLRRYPTPDEQKLGFHRSRSSVEIQKYAEDENEDPEDFLGKDVMLPVHDSDSGSEPSTLMMLNSKLSTNGWLGDEDEDDDPFAQLEEDFDELDLETNIARDRYARLCKFVEELVGEMKKNLVPDALAHHSEQLMQVLIESPELKGTIVTSHGMLPILEILDTCQMQDVILRLLKIVNMIIYENEELMETLCFLGGIPIISRFADQRVSSQIRLEAAAFVRQMCQGSTLTLQMFIGCGGLNVLCDFLEEDLETERDLVLIGVMGVYNVFELQVC